ncbi:tRNA 4-thiouridine(8) synthase ThiI [Orenia metallireducens]|uniref:Probable tRNA sulfurtransferase n=1 Tax=Orenia metallireducens TaxID=1413210 RepID=A0A1C0A840_9FIRM|nr:tRNA uracil 4-sulfurtransferase ThiI [Orenia metallireducens]OCL26425.1 tRNA 4-thiouridine(8) synthase ThiI [Orenia metallireducens]
MKRLYLIRYGEIGLKGKNRFMFEDKLISNIIKTLKKESDELDVYKTYGRIYVETDLARDKVISKLQKVFGIVGIAPACEVELDVDQVKNASLEMVQEALPKSGVTTFKVNARRNNKSFPLNSMELNRELGAHILINTEDGRLEVDVHNPELMVNVEVRKKAVYIYTQDIPGSGGLPVGVTGTAGLLLSGGIDSPVAGWMLMKRGVKIVPIYFHSFPFTSDRAKEKVIDLAETLATYQGETKLHVVHFTDIQTEMNDKCPAELTTIIMRRIMMRIAEQITLNNGGKSLLTGESMGQVASQTMESMYVTNMVPEMPVFRPLIGLDKVEIIEIAKRIGTYETSIQPYEDCCTVFVPEKPATKATPEDVEEGEKDLHIDDLIEKAIDEVEVITINPYK